MEGTIGRGGGKNFADRLYTAFTCSFCALQHQCGRSHADNQTVAPTIERSRRIGDGFVRGGSSTGKKAGAHPVDEVVGGDVVGGDDDYARAAPNANPVLGDSHSLRGRGARGIDLRVRAAGSDEFGKLRVSHGERAQQEAALKNIGILFDCTAQLRDTLLQLGQKYRMAVLVGRLGSKIFERGKLLALGLIGVITGHLVGERVEAGERRCENHAGAVTQSVRQTPAIG